MGLDDWSFGGRDATIQGKEREAEALWKIVTDFDLRRKYPGLVHQASLFLLEIAKDVAKESEQLIVRTSADE